MICSRFFHRVYPYPSGKLLSGLKGVEGVNRRVYPATQRRLATPSSTLVRNAAVDLRSACDGSCRESKISSS